MTPYLNQVTYRALEIETNKFAEDLGSVTVTVTPIYDANPPRLTDGTPVPRAVHRLVRAPDGTVLQDVTLDNEPGPAFSAAASPGPPVRVAEAQSSAEPSAEPPTETPARRLRLDSSGNVVDLDELEAAEQEAPNAEQAQPKKLYLQLPKK